MIGPCYITIDESGTCQRKITSFLSKSECCNSVGLAWGVNCESCEEAVDCKPGMERVGTNCVDINDDRKVFVLNCEEGYVLDPSGAKCIGY